MSDNRTTELLCKLLDERGEDYTRNDFGITWSYYSDPHTATESMDGTLIVTGLTPEQAIAATLGSDDGYEAKMDELLCRLTNGKWSKSRAYSIEFMVSCIDEEYDDAYEKERAELGNGTCKLEETESYPSECGMVHVLECSNCGRECEHVNGDYEHCPHCLARNELF